MSETNAVTPADPVHLVWSTLCEQGFDAAQHRAVSLLQDGSTPQLHADLENERDFPVPRLRRKPRVGINVP